MPRLLLVMLLALAALSLGACGGEEPSEGEIVVVPPEPATQGPSLDVAEWREAVEAVCAETQREVNAASTELAAELPSDPADRDEGEVSRRVFEATSPIIEEQLASLAALRPPTRFEGDYGALIGALALDLELTGRVAFTIDEEGGSETAESLAQQLGAVGSRARRLLRQLGLESCLPGSGAEADADG